MKGATLQSLRNFAASGLTRRECAERLGYSYASISIIGKKHGIAFRRKIWSGVRAAPDDRSRTMASMYESGFTLQRIGDLYGISRERVRQLINSRHALTGKDGGMRRNAEAKRQEKLARREARCLQQHGCSLSQLAELHAIGRSMVGNGMNYYRTPTGAFRSQRCNAKIRGIDWDMTLWQWWTIWLQSGHWEERGRGHGYMMCRYGDVGSYTIGNVYIATGVHNGSVQPNNPFRKGHPNYSEAIRSRRAGRREPNAASLHRVNVGLPKGVTLHKKSGRYQAQRSIDGANRYLGMFGSPDEAYAAYLRATPVGSAA